MRRLRVLAWRIAALFGRARQDRALDDEIASLLALHTDEHLRRGLSPADAAAAARRELGGSEAMKDAYRDQRGLPFIDALAQDVRFAVRSFARDRRLFAISVMTLMLGIGANTALFSVVDAVILKPLPYRDPDRLIWITENAPAFARVIGSDVDAWRAASRSFTSLTVVTTSEATLSGERAERVRVLAMDGDVGTAFGLSPSPGRDFLPEDFDHAPRTLFGLPAAGDNRSGAAIISRRLFDRRFEGDARVIGTSLLIGRMPYTIVGVMPDTFRMPLGVLVRNGFGAAVDPDVIVSLATGPEFTSGGAVVGRLKNGVDLNEARADLLRIRTIADRTREGRRKTASLSLVVEPVHERIVGSTRRPVLMLWGACGFVLLVASVNVASLLLARAASRRKELAVRTALGAGRRRLVRLLMTESLIVAAVGGVGGVATAWGLVRLLRLTSVDVPRLADATLDWRVLLFTLLVCALSGVVAGVLPALVDAGHLPATQLGGEGWTSSPSRRRQRVQSALVIGELAITLILLTGAGLMIKSLWLVQSQIGALNPAAVVSSRVEPYDPQLVERAADRLRFSETLTRGLEASPDITAAAFWNVPFVFVSDIDGIPADVRGQAAAAIWLGVTPHFHTAAGVRLLAGRWLDERNDDAAGVVVSAAFVKTLPAQFQSYDRLLGRRIGGPVKGGQDPLTIVGVATDFRTGVADGTPPDDDATAMPQVYFANAASPANGGDLLIRTSATPAEIGRRLRQLIAATPQVNVLEPRTLEDRILSAITPRRFQTTLLVAFAVVTLLLALVGTATVISHAVTERTREIGIRMAIGATRGEILRTVVGRGAALILFGMAIGISGSVATVQIIRSLLYHVDPTDTWTYAGGCALLATLALVAAYLPARRATNITPLVAMRYE